MFRRLSFAAFAGLGLVVFAANAEAANWHPAAEGARYAGSARQVAETHFDTERDALALDGVDLRFQNELRVGAHRTVRFAQVHRGVPVLGTTASVRIASDGVVKVAVLQVARDLSVSTEPTLSAEAAIAAVSSRVGAVPGAHAALAVLPHRAGVLVWVVDTPTSRGGHRYLVDANDGRALGDRPLAVDVKGRVYTQSSVVTPTPVDVDLVDLVVASPQKLTGHGGQLTVTNYVSGGTMGGEITLAQDLTPNVGEDFLYDPPAEKTDATDGFAQVGVYHHLSRIKDYFTTTFGIDMTPASWKLTAAANMLEDGAPMDNAFFSPEGATGVFASPNFIAIGQGTSFDFADDSDVFLHEFGHYVSHNAVGYNEGIATNEWGLSLFGGGIDEGIADYFACTLNDDPLLGEASLAQLGAARDLTKTDKRCPDDVFGEPHADGEIIGSVGWSLRTALGAAAADQLVWGAVSLLTKGPSLGDFGKGLIQTANDLVADGVLTDADVEQVQTIVKGRGLDDCDYELAIDADHPERKTTMIGLDTLGQLFGADCGSLQGFGFELQSLYHFAATPAAGDQGIRFAVDIESSSGGALKWNIYVRKNEHVGFSPGTALPVPEITDYDYAVEGITEPSGEIVIDASSDPPFDPTASYHMVIGQANCPTTLATVTVTSATTGGEGGAGAGGSPAATGAGTGGQAPDPKAGPGPEDDSGCGCRVAGATDATGGAALLGLMVSALALGARRRRRHA